jgi:hypothetical protein
MKIKNKQYIAKLHIKMVKKKHIPLSNELIWWETKKKLISSIQPQWDGCRILSA